MRTYSYCDRTKVKELLQESFEERRGRLRPQPRAGDAVDRTRRNNHGPNVQHLGDNGLPDIYVNFVKQENFQTVKTFSALRRRVRNYDDSRKGLGMGMVI